MGGQPRYTRRTVLRAGGGMVALGTLSPYSRLLATAAAAPGTRAPGSLPDPSRPPGTPTAALPFDHIVVVMMENHSFDNYFGMLAHRGQPQADGFSFDASGRPLDSNPVKDGFIRVQHAPSLCTPDGSASQSWHDTHLSIDGGRMDGFARLGESSMVYWDDSDLPFYYSLARTFCLANRWFCSAPCQTYPNRRFLMAGTAYGNIATNSESLKDPPPPNGTIWDQLSAHGISWRNYFTDLPSTAIIPSTVEKHPANLAPIAQFHLDCAAGTLPAVSLVDPEFGVASEVGSGLAGVPALRQYAEGLQTVGGDEEGPQDMAYGERWAWETVKAVLESPAWPRTLLIYTYDEHGGFYDHVAPPPAIEPDSIPPALGPEDVPGAYNIYGPRVPAVIASPYARPNAVTDAVHDHTSFLATVEAKWNLPALSYRDANAKTVMDFLDVSQAAFLKPPALAEPPVPTEAAQRA